MMTAASESTPAGKLATRNYLNLAAYVLNSVITYVSLTGVFGETNSDLSSKYQTLVTPAGYAFSIWGPIFIWEGVFAVCQMLPRFRGTPVVELASPWWWGACICQCCWTLAFAQEAIALSLLMMLGILACLLGLVLATDHVQLGWADYFLLRAPFCLHLGWIICASAVNANVQADSAKAAPQALLAMAVLSFAVVGAVNSALVFAAKSPDPITSLVACWAFAAIGSELGDAANLAKPDRHNPFLWPALVLGGLRKAAGWAAVLAAVLAAAALLRRAAREWKKARGEPTPSEVERSLA